MAAFPSEFEYERMAEAFDRGEEEYRRTQQYWENVREGEAAYTDVSATEYATTEEEYINAYEYWENVREQENEREMAQMRWENENAEEYYERDYYTLPIPVRLEPIFQDQYHMSEDEWEEIWDNQRGPRLPPRSPVYDSPTNEINPKLGDIVTFSICGSSMNAETQTKMKTEEFDCPICYTSVCKWDAIHLNCTHSFCGSCISSHLDTLHKNHALLPSCALCRNEYTAFEIPNPEMSNKIEMMLRK